MTAPRITDRDVRAAFLARASGAPSADLAARIHEATSTVKQSRPFLVLPGFVNPAVTRLAWAAVLAALTIALVGVIAFGAGLFNPNPITSDGPTPTPGQSEQPAPSPSDDPSAEPSVEPTLPVVTPQPSQPTQPVLRMYGLGRVITDNLRVRSQPGLGPESLPREPLIDSGADFYILNGPVEFDGYAWYQIQPFDRSLPFGWVAAASREGEPWTEAVEPECPSAPSLEVLAGMDLLVALSCYGDSELELTGELVCSLSDVDTMVSGPDWIELDRTCFFEVSDRLYPIVGRAVTGLIDDNGGNTVSGRYTVVGHFDDEQATECEHAPVEVGEQPDPAQVYNNCRTAFVVTEVRPAD